MGTPRSIIFAGCARDCAPFLPQVLTNIQRISSLVSRAALIVCENDSTDATNRILSASGSATPNFHLVNLNGLGSCPVRTLRLEFARNVLIEMIRTSEVLRGFELLFLLDFDDVNAAELDLGRLSDALEWMSGQTDVAGIFPNQIGPYYDMWALRHEARCPNDIWEEVLDYHLVHKCDDQTAFAATFAKRTFTLPEDAAPMQVDSAFGGFGVYRLEYVLKNRNPYLGQKVKVIRDADKYSILRWQQCEHVHFHAGIRNLGGRLFVMPRLLNGSTKDFTVSPSAFRNKIF
jgi:hypothetical protein